ncbi:prolyl 4-hydroxylase subunit alpha-3 isoform X2 [Latimeria chalumnae]|uniref:prolyl 4-hydroxylase subunit alpha-3 isoform X2 n=1 Tax=Latimeria chalumnae TaxID=7897 RepID=UPI00313E2F91
MHGFEKMLSLILCLFIIGLLKLTQGEIYTSMISVQQAIAVEKELLQSLKTYIQDETYRLNDLIRFHEKVRNLHNNIYQGSTNAGSNPLLAYTLIKRLQLEWMNVVHSNEANENILALKNGYEQVERKLPQFEDLEGAAKGLMRLQDVYALSVKGLVRGQFQRVTRSSEVSDIYSPPLPFTLSADDCFQIGKVAYDMEDYYHSIAWLEEAVTLFRQSHGNWFTEDQGSLEDSLDYLAFSYFKMGNISYALTLSREFLHHDPSNKRIARNVHKYEKLLATMPPSRGPEVEVQRPNVTHLLTREVYESLCQSLGSQPRHYQDPKLHCSYVTSKSPLLILQPMRREIISLQPYVVLYHNFINDLEAEAIKRTAAPGLQRSVVASGENQSAVEYRISKSAWLKDTANPVVSKLDQRIAALTGLNVQPPYAEYLQVVNYGIGGHYEPHFDHATSSKSPLYRLNSGNRVATFMIYNAALFWWNLHKNGQGNGETLHAGCPVLIGDKWVANKWIREYGQEFHRPCSANPDD